MLFKKWSTCWAEAICRAAGETDSYKIALTRYVFESLLSMSLSFSFILIAAYLFNVVKTAILISLSSAFIKAFTGGLHSSTPLRCAIVSALFSLILSFSAKYLPLVNIPIPFVLMILAVSNVIVWLKAPKESKAKPLTPKQKVYLSALSKTVVFAASLICIFLPAAGGVNEFFYGMSFQVISLLDITEKTMDKLDIFLSKIERQPVF